MGRRRARRREAASSAAAHAAMYLYASSMVLSFSTAVDSALEHYRGGYYNKLMYVGPGIATFTLGAAAAEFARKWPTQGRWIFSTAVLTGLVGTSFHVYNISKREGGWWWVNLFYGAPLAAPLGLSVAGLFGLAAGRLSARPEPAKTRLGRREGARLSLLAATGLFGTALEAGLLHFRGAFHDPIMLLPVTLPPLAATGLGLAATKPTPSRRKLARTLLGGVALLGLAGTCLHAYGIQRNMGGWRNWSQNIMNGPPLPAPPAFTGMALAGLAGLALLQGGERD